MSNSHFSSMFFFHFILQFSFIWKTICPLKLKFLSTTLKKWKAYEKLQNTKWNQKQIQSINFGNLSNSISHNLNFFYQLHFTIIFINGNRYVKIVVNRHFSALLWSKPPTIPSPKPKNRPFIRYADRRSSDIPSIRHLLSVPFIDVDVPCLMCLIGYNVYCAELNRLWLTRRPHFCTKC